MIAWNETVREVFNGRTYVHWRCSACRAHACTDAGVVGPGECLRCKRSKG